MVITTSLLSALLGAIILATVTTERPTRVADILPLQSTACVAAVAALSFTFPISCPDAVSTVLLLQDFLYSIFDNNFFAGVLFMSVLDVTKGGLTKRHSDCKILYVEKVESVDQFKYARKRVRRRPYRFGRR